jgi:hypothetical protein
MDNKFSKGALLSDARENVAYILMTELFLYGVFDFPIRVDVSAGLLVFFTALSLARKLS